MKAKGGYTKVVMASVLSGENKFTCEVENCSYMTDNKTNLTRHVRQTHNCEKTKCYVCGKSVKNIHLHLRQVHKIFKGQKNKNVVSEEVEFVLDKTKFVVVEEEKVKSMVNTLETSLKHIESEAKKNIFPEGRCTFYTCYFQNDLNEKSKKLNAI